MPLHAAKPAPLDAASTTGSMNDSLRARFAAGVKLTPPSSERA
jgi:hypothetical protein